MTLRDLFLRVRALAARRRVEREFDEELAFHIERETQKHIAAGLNAADARTRARARFGPVTLAADQCRDARGTGFVDALVRDIVYAFRSFRRAPLAAFTIVATIGLGLGLLTAVFAIYNSLFLRPDAVRSPSELFAVRPDEKSPLTWPDYDAMRRETSVFTAAFATISPVLTRVDGRTAIAALVTGNFFELLGARPALGRPLLPEDDARFAGRPVVVLSHAGWRKLFAGDAAVIGRRAVINGAPYEIVGVMPEGFRGLALTPPDYWAPVTLAGQFSDEYAQRDEVEIEIIGRLKSGISSEAAAAALTVWAERRTDVKPSNGRPSAIRLTPHQGTLSADRGEMVEWLMLFTPVFFAFGLILMIGCANVANLLLARGLARQREIGIRLSLGASRRRVLRQLLTESLLLALAAAVCGLGIARVFLDTVLYAATATIPPDLAEFVTAFNLRTPASDWRVLVFLVVGAMVSTVFFGLAPALQATRLELVRTMRGEVTKDARPSRARHALIACQVGASALLLICAVIFLRGAAAAATRDPGVRTLDTVRLMHFSEPRRTTLLQAMTAHPSVVVVAASSRTTRSVAEAALPTGASDRTAETSISLPVDQTAVSRDYFEVLGLDVLSGRGFTPAERTEDAGVAIVSEIVARRLWPNRNAVGELVRLQAHRSDSEDTQPPPPHAFTVVGVVRDPGGSLASVRGSVDLPTSPERTETRLWLRVHGDPELARQALLERLVPVDPVVQILTLRSMAGASTYLLRIAFRVTVALGGLALVLTVSGLFSVLSYVVEQRATEIGVRMALGATTRHVVKGVLYESLRPVGIGLAAGVGLAAAVAIVLMSTSAASEIGGTVDVFDPVVYAASLLVILTSCGMAATIPVLRAARIDPIATLREN